MEISHILVAYKGDPGDEQLLRMGCRVAREVRARLSALHVLEVPMSFTLDSPNVPGADQAERLIERCDEIGSELGVSVNAETVNARDAGCAIIDHAKSMGVDLILISAGERPRVGRVALNRTSEFVLANAPCAVVVGRFARRSNGAAP